MQNAMLRLDCLLLRRKKTVLAVWALILVDALKYENGNTAWGLTTWLPGNATSTGHPMAGVFVNISLSTSQHDPALEAALRWIPEGPRGR